MKIKSNEFNNYNFLPKTCGYRYGNKAPSLLIEDVPQNATSLALYVFDSDVIYNEEELTHWMVWNIPVNAGMISAEYLPQDAIQGTNDMGVIGYSGPFLERDIHHIHFVVFALNTPFSLDTTATRKDFDEAITANFIDHASIIGMFQDI